MPDAVRPSALFALAGALGARETPRSARLDVDRRGTEVAAIFEWFLGSAKALSTSNTPRAPPAA